MRNRALKFTLGFIIVSLVITTLIIFVQRNAINTYHKNLSYASLRDQVKSQTAQANLWIEQVKHAEANLNFERDVLQSLS
jgi:hypothetical protein